MDEQTNEAGAKARGPVIASRVALVAAGLVLAFGAGIIAREMLTGGARNMQIEGFLWPDPREVGPFELVDHEGAPFDRARLDGKWTLMFFGYTHCPDVCPVTLTVLKQAYAALESAGAGLGDVQTVFVSVDPARDTVEHLREYVTFFDPRFLGVTGPEAALQAFTRQLGILYIVNPPDESGDYMVDHTASVLLLDPEHRLVGLLGAPHDAVTIADRFTRIRQVVEG